ncbi:hypothetical protein ABRP57_09550 [Pectobacterium aroidearum]|uniref:hypothetical protein n=1 Tax=Pectobacterium aroidearum TaxID=1201031 RepID=UPI0032EC9D49
MTTERFVPDEKTLRDLVVLNHLLSKPTGNAEKDARNAALVEEHNAAVRDGKKIHASVADCVITQNARRELGQIN